MHQHIFKVGWLLTHNRKTTVVFYYTAFLPGIALHELCRWLTAGILNVRATRAALLPEHDEIGKLQLSLVQVSPNARALKRMIIEAAPAIVAFAALWLIATDMLDLESSLRIAAGGSVGDYGRAIGILSEQPDFWLWFYLMFTIANTMLPPASEALRNRYRLTSALILAGACAIGLVSDLESMAILGADLRRLLSSLSLVLFFTVIINLVMVLALGLIEAVIERLTGHSATFDQGKLITRTRQQALAERGDRKREDRSQRTQRAAAKAGKPIRSIYALPLPIPGPPGKEPVSKPVAAVLNVASRHDPALNRAPDRMSAPVVSGDPTHKSQSFGSRPKQMPETIDRAATDLAQRRFPAPVQRPPTARPADASPSQAMPADFNHEIHEHAPFSRPFAASPDTVDDPVDSQDTQLPDPGFSRPFAPPQDLPPGFETDDTDPGDAPQASDAATSTTATNPPVGRRRPLTRPVPKPSERSSHDDIDNSPDELSYEALDDIAPYDDGDAFDVDSS